MTPEEVREQLKKMFNLHLAIPLDPADLTETRGFLWLTDDYKNEKVENLIESCLAIFKESGYGKNY